LKDLNGMIYTFGAKIIKKIKLDGVEDRVRC
jgi:hypothetical protein